MASVFTRIIKNELPSYRLLENENVLAILTIEPIQLGHTLIIPKIEVESFYDLEEPYYSEIFAFAKKLSPAIEKATACRKVGAAFVGLEVPHVHLHLIPLYDASDLDFRKAKGRTEEEMSRIQAAIQAAL